MCPLGSFVILKFTKVKCSPAGLVSGWVTIPLRKTEALDRKYGSVLVSRQPSSSYLSNSSDNRTRNVELDNHKIDLDFEHSVIELDYLLSKNS